MACCTAFSGAQNMPSGSKVRQIGAQQLGGAVGVTMHRIVNDPRALIPISVVIEAIEGQPRLAGV